MRRAGQLIAGHAINGARLAGGRPPVTGVWLWGQGQPRPFESFAQRYRLRGAVITAVDIIRGIARNLELDLIPVAGATGYLDTDYGAKGRAAVAALQTYDVVLVHVEAPDEAAHLGRADEKIKALERVDELVLGPLLAHLRALPAWRVLVAPDHVTSTRTTAHHGAPPPFCMAGTGIGPGAGTHFSEAEAVASGVWCEDATSLLREFF
jgi:2,3-bisphosphoglycerate-independent phosphoglycerate mutase